MQPLGPYVAVSLLGLMVGFFVGRLLAEVRAVAKREREELGSKAEEETASSFTGLH